MDSFFWNMKKILSFLNQSERKNMNHHEYIIEYFIVHQCRHSFFFFLVCASRSLLAPPAAFSWKTIIKEFMATIFELWILCIFSMHSRIFVFFFFCMLNVKIGKLAAVFTLLNPTYNMHHWKQANTF